MDSARFAEAGALVEASYGVDVGASSVQQRLVDDVADGFLQRQRLGSAIAFNCH